MIQFYRRFSTGQGVVFDLFHHLFKGNFTFMNQIKTTLLLLLIVPLCSYGQTTWRFLNLPATPLQAAASGHASVLSGEEDAFLSNPAFAPTLRSGTLTTSYTRYVADIDMGALTYSAELPFAGMVGFSVHYINYGSMPETDESGNKTGTFSASDLVAGVTGGYSIADTLSIGVSVKFVSSYIGVYNSSGMVTDVGIYHQWNQLGLFTGLILRNAGYQFDGYSKQEKLPTSLNLQVGKSLKYLPVTLGLELNDIGQVEEDDFKIINLLIVSGKISLSPTLTVYASSHLGRREELKTSGGFDLSGINFGASLAAKAFSMQYSYANLGLFEGVHRFGVSFNLESITGQVRD